MAVHLSRSHSQGRLCFLAWALIVLLCFVSVESEEQTCTADGSCKATQSEETSENDIPPFPVADAEGYLTIKYGEKQKVEGTKADETLQRAREVHNYMYTKVFKTTNGGDDKNLLDVAHDCLNRHELCTFWAAIGECEANPAYMKLQCAPACLSCDQLSFETRCPYDKDAPKAWNPGDLHRMFERITADEFYQQYEPHVLGKPGMKVGPLTDAPWVVVLDKFLTDEECETLIRLGGEQGYEISKDVGNQKFDGTYDSYENSGRTSTNAWCLNACYDDAVTQRILQKIENLTGIPDQNSEYLQLLRYEPEQFYQGTTRDCRDAVCSPSIDSPFLTPRLTLAFLL
jgi:prolyl 4-hydroxylase